MPHHLKADKQQTPIVRTIMSSYQSFGNEAGLQVFKIEQDSTEEGVDAEVWVLEVFVVVFAPWREGVVGVLFALLNTSVLWLVHS
jgi:hypothetical protein